MDPCLWRFPLSHCTDNVVRTARAGGRARCGHVFAVYSAVFICTTRCRHMCVCSALAHLAVRGGMVAAVSIDTDTYLRAIAPIGACYAFSLWVGNAAFLYLSVSFRQMFNVSSPRRCECLPAGVRSRPNLTHGCTLLQVLFHHLMPGFDARDSFHCRLHVWG